MAKIKKLEKELDLIKDSIAGDSQLTTLDFMLSDCRTQQAKFDKLDEVCEIIAGCKISKHDLYINILCKNHNLPKGTFKTLLKHYKKAIAETETEINNIPRVTKIENFITNIHKLRYNIVSQNLEFFNTELNIWSSFDEFTISNIARKIRKQHFTISKSAYVTPFQIWSPAVDFIVDLALWLFGFGYVMGESIWQKQERDFHKEDHVA